jgi:hypothetical protein
MTRLTTLQRDIQILDWIRTDPDSHSPKTAAVYFQMTVWAVYKAIHRAERRIKDVGRMEGERRKHDRPGNQ